jgi:hypothetical protein
LRRLRSERVIVDTEEIALECAVLLRPTALENLDEFGRLATAFFMLQPGLAERSVLAAVPAADDIDCLPPIRKGIGGRSNLGHDTRMP